VQRRYCNEDQDFRFTFILKQIFRSHDFGFSQQWLNHQTDFMLGLFDPEDGGDMFLRNAG
jgi:hypothetical protein